MSKVLVRIRGLAKDYKRGIETVHVLQALDLEINEGDFLALMGPSGSGKSTLVRDVLYAGLRRRLGLTAGRVGKHRNITGYGGIERVIEVDQSPIGRTPRSIPASSPLR